MPSPVDENATPPGTGQARPDAVQAVDPLAHVKLGAEDRQLLDTIRGRLHTVAGLAQENIDRLALAAVAGNSDHDNPSRVAVDKVAVWNHPQEGVKVSLMNQHGEHNTFGLRDAPSIEQSAQTIERLQQQQTQQAATQQVVERDNVVSLGSRNT